jgi:hypothetical protein
MNMSKISSSKIQKNNDKLKRLSKAEEIDGEEGSEHELDIDPEEEEISNLISKPKKSNKAGATSFDEELIERELERENWD